MSSKSSRDRKPSISKPKTGAKHRATRSTMSSTTPQATPLSSNSFVGETKELEGHIYYVGTSKQSEMFTNTTKKVANFAGRNCKESKDISLAIEDLSDHVFTLPTKQNTGDSEIDTLLLREEMQIYSKRKSTYRQNQATMFAVVLGQCSDAFKAKL